MAGSHPVIDADGHVMESDEELYTYLPRPYREIPRFKTFGFFPSLDGFQRGFAVAGKVHEVTAATWKDFMEAAQIDVSVLYPSAGLGAGLILDPNWAVSVCQAYNDWLYDRFTRTNPALRGVALLPVQDPAAAARELARARDDLGFVAGLMPAVTCLSAGFGDRRFDPLYEAASRLNMPLTVHGAPSRGMGFDFLPTFIQVHTLEHPVAIFIQFTSMLFEGVFERFPSLRVAYLEAGSGWLPYFMDRMDEEYEKPYRFQAPELLHSPRDIIRRGQVWVTAEVEERLLPVVLSQFNPDCVMWPSDFPHERLPKMFISDIPTLMERSDLTTEQKRKILYDNPRRFYGLSV